MKIQVRINEEGALRNQRFAFTDRFTLVTELLQNARRAGAHHIVVDHQADDELLRVCDDGHGIEDFQKLLSFHESGWGDDTVNLEHPFGIGFTKCLYAASRVVITSGRQRVDIDTAAALRRKPFEVELATEAVNGTTIELHGVDIAGLAQRMETLCQGFPVDVVFNGQRLARRYAEGHLPLVPTPIGAVHVAGDRDGKSTRETLVFLQGFCVKAPLYFKADEVNVVHLDPRQFMARLPDRDILIDADQQLRRVDSQLKQSWRQILEVAKAQLPARQYVDTYFDTMRRWGHVDLLNDLDELPAELFERIVGYPIQTQYGERDYVEKLEVAPSRADIELGAVTLVSLDWPDDENAAQWMLARQKQWLVAQVHTLDSAHWVRPYVRYIEEQGVQVMPLQEKAHTTLEGRWIWPQIVLCESVRIRIGEDQVDIVGEGVCSDGNILIPVGETSGDPVRQLSNFIDENERYREDDMEADREALADLIRRLRSTDPAVTLTSLLTSLNLGKYPLLRGKRFEVAVGVGAMPGCSVGLLDAAVAAQQPGGDDHAGR